MSNIFITSIVAASMYLTPLASRPQSTQLRNNRETVQSIVKNFALANSSDVQSFRYGEFDRAITSLHPVLLWATLRYLNERSTGSRKQHVAQYIQHSQVVPTLNQSLAQAQQPQTAEALQLFETLVSPLSLKDVTENSFLEIVDKLINELRSQRI